MNIIIVNETSDLGGAEAMAIELANALSAVSGNKVAFASAAGMLTERLEGRVKFFPISRYSLRSFFKIYSELGSIFQKWNFDIIHAQGATIGLIAGIAARMLSPNTKVVITHHSARFTRIPSCLANFLLNRFVDKFIAISDARYNSFIKAGFNKEKVVLISNFVDRERLFSQAACENMTKLKYSLGVLDGEKIVVGAGRLLPDKRFDIFIKTLVDCARQASDIRIFGFILGDGPERRRLQDLVDRLAIPNLRIKLLGFQSNVGAYLKMADIFLFTSEHEVLPMCLIEATSLGVPIVCSDIPGNNDIVENKYNGFLVDPRKLDYSFPVLTLLKDNILAKQFSSNGTTKAEDSYDKGKVVTNIIHLYNSMVRKDAE
jgi:glycosyltransferase EpsD